MFNNESQNEEYDWMGCSFLFNKMPLYEFNLFNNNEYESQFKEEIINSIITLNKLNVNRNENLEDSEYIDANPREKSNIFKVTIKNTNLGRKRKDETEIFTDNGHSKYHPDNILTKIQVHFISFIIIFVNIVLRTLGYKEQFNQINYKFKKNVSKTNIDTLIKSNIGYILSQEISSKYKKDKKHNIIIYKTLENKPILRNIFSYNYKDFFKNFYCSKESNINLNKFDSNINIDLYKFGEEMYKDLKEKNINDPLYIQKLEEVVNNIFKSK